MKEKLIIGRVEDIWLDTGYVTLHLLSTNEIVESSCDASLLTDKGIKIGDEFEVKFVKKDGKTVAELIYLPPKKITKKDVKEIREKLKRIGFEV